MRRHMDANRPTTPSYPESRGCSKKPYEKPAFRHEQIFETMALACGKINTTQQACRANRRNS
jgi:hypothetical protein